MAFNIKDFLNEESKKEVIDDFPIKKISAKKLHPSKQNFYNIDPAEIEALKNSIELVGVQENLVVKEITEGEYTGEYEIIAGHKRHKAVMELIAEGKTTEFLPCKIDYSGSNAVRELILIFTNSTQRERTDYEKMHEIQRVRELLEEYSKGNDLPGRKRDIIAGILNTSKSSISRLDNIRKNIIPEFMDIYKAGAITTATANELAGVSTDGQKKLWQQYKETGNIDTKTARTAKEEENAPEQIPGQDSIFNHPEYIPEENNQEETKVTPDPEDKGQQEPAEDPKKEDTTVTIAREHDTTDRETLIIAGAINPSKEYNGMNVSYFIDAITNSDIFDNDFWESWQDPEKNKATLMQELAGVFTTFNSRSAEPCECTINGSFEITRKEAHTTAHICFKELSDLIDALIYTKVIKIKTETIDIAYWGKQTAREIAQRAMYLTENELAVMQDIALKLKERAGN